MNYMSHESLLTIHRSAFYGKPLPDEQRFALLDQIYELGERNWDSG